MRVVCNYFRIVGQEWIKLLTENYDKNSDIRCRICQGDNVDFLVSLIIVLSHLITKGNFCIST